VTAPNATGSASPAGGRVVAVGGGTGLAALLSGLKELVGGAIDDLAAVVAVTDDGGSSGRLRRDFGVLPPGDIRNCLAALADDSDLATRLFQYRFEGGEGLSGHSFGNLFLTALTALTGDFPQAILTAERVLRTRGRILPATLASVHLAAETVGGGRIEGETSIGATRERIARVELVPAEAPAFAPAVEAVLAADLVLLGPGSLYTSILPNLLFSELARGIASTRARVALVMNLMTQPGETDGLTALEHLTALEQHLGRGVVDLVLVHFGQLPADRTAAYRRATGAEPVRLDRAALAAAGVEIVEADLLASEGLLRHDSRKLAAAIAALLPAPRP